MKKTIKIKDINYCKNDLNNLCNTKYNHDVVDAIRLTEKDTYEYRLVTKVLHNGFGLTLAAVIFASGFYLGSRMERNAFEKRAIDAGVGEYIIVDPYTGESQFDFVNLKEISNTFGLIK